MFTDMEADLKLKDVSVLCVEDESFTLEFLTQMLGPRVKEVHQARDGQEGLYAFSRFNPDIVITDIEMPRMDGLEMAEAIREQDPEAVVILSTSFDSINNLKKAITLRLDEFVSKPVAPAELLEGMQRCLKVISRKKAKDRQRRTMEVMLGGMPFPVMLLDTENHRVEIANPEAGRAGYRQGAALEGRFFPPEVCQVIKSKGNAGDLLEAREQSRLEISSGDKNWEIYLKPVAPGWMVAAVVDVTWRWHLDQLREDVERITRHDMKTPLNGIIAIPDLLLESDALDDESRELVQYIKESGHTLLNMINLSLDLYKMEQGTYQLDPGKVDLIRVLRQVLRQLEPLSRGKNIQVRLLHQEMDVPDDFSFMVCGEEMLCYSMFSNLIKNALEASPQGKEVSIKMRHQAGESLITIHNHGEVPREIREVFFDKLSTHGKKSGTGLGTYSAALIARTQNGNIDMQTSVESGTTLTVRLPLCQ